MAKHHWGGVDLELILVFIGYFTNLGEHIFNTNQEEYKGRAAKALFWFNSFIWYSTGNRRSPVPGEEINKQKNQ